MLSLPDGLGLTAARVPVTTENFAFGVLPPVACYLATAFLVLLPRTQLSRIALWPITAILAFRAATSLDMCMGQPKLDFLNIDLQLPMFCMAARTFEWTVRTKPFIRCGWDWSQGLYVPPETHSTSSRLAFSTSALVSGLKHSLLCGAIHSTVQSFSPHTFGSVDGGTIFDDSLPPHLRYLRSSTIATLCAFSIYSVLQAGYELTIVLCVLLFRQHPDQCPPSFHSPWRATSLREFWSRRWHQWFRRYPLSLLFGRIGGMWRMLLPFGMMGVGVVIERAVAGNRTGGWMGWMWTMCWLVLWGNVMVDGWARAGMFGGSSILDSATPVKQPIERLVRTFDEYLHAYQQKSIE
ncbi:hypothetical protein BDR05DRAFT_966180 [Suillus weaverae]|nr:hypothetical protein BDR05DRAFT_966180 [Suillus weaverae]